MDTDQIIELAEAYVGHTGLKLSTVSTYATGDGKRFDYYKAGGGCTVRVALRTLSWFDSHWPEDLTWPALIDRPTLPGRQFRTKRRAA